MAGTVGHQIFTLLVLAIPIACVARTVVYEEIFRQWRDFCVSRSKTCRSLVERKFFYLFTCEYCFSHWVALGFLILADFKLLFDDWRGWLVGFFSLVFIANVYLSVYARVRVDITSEKAIAKAREKQAEKLEVEIAREKSRP